MKSSALCGISCSVIIFSTGVWTGFGVTVLMLPQARPRSPSPAPWVNWSDIWFASSTAWFLIVSPPIVTLSVPTVPDAEEESPYEICHFEPFATLYVDDLVGS